MRFFLVVLLVASALVACDRHRRAQYPEEGAAGEEDAGARATDAGAPPVTQQPGDLQL